MCAHGGRGGQETPSAPEATTEDMVRACISPAPSQPWERPKVSAHNLLSVRALCSWSLQSPSLVPSFQNDKIQVQLCLERKPDEKHFYKKQPALDQFQKPHPGESCPQEPGTLDTRRIYARNLGIPEGKMLLRKPYQSYLEKQRDWAEGKRSCHLCQGFLKHCSD